MHAPTVGWEHRESTPADWLLAGPRTPCVHWSGEGALAPLFVNHPSRSLRDFLSVDSYNITVNGCLVTVMAKQSFSPDSLAPALRSLREPQPQHGRLMIMQDRPWHLHDSIHTMEAKLRAGKW